MPTGIAPSVYLQWELPEEMAWSRHEHEGSHYWHNSETGENTVSPMLGTEGGALPHFCC